jgi:hypothetical protein
MSMLVWVCNIIVNACQCLMFQTSKIVANKFALSEMSIFLMENHYWAYHIYSFLKKTNRAPFTTSPERYTIFPNMCISTGCITRKQTWLLLVFFRQHHSPPPQNVILSSRTHVLALVASPENLALATVYSWAYYWILLSQVGVALGNYYLIEN